MYHQSKKYQSKYTSYEKFLHAIYSVETKRTYTKYLQSFLNFCKFTDYDHLVQMSDDDKYNSISDYLIYLREERELSSSSLRTQFAAVKKFFQMNNVKIDWDQLGHYKRGKKNNGNNSNNNKTEIDRTYTFEEIVQLLDHADLRMKVVILTMLSTGMRVGGLAGIRLKDMEYIDKYRIYKFTVYSDDISEKYITFCTPECADTINKYLQYRKQVGGDNLTPESPLIYRTKMNGIIENKVLLVPVFNESVSSHSLQQLVSRLQHKANVVSVQKESDYAKRAKIRKQMMRCHSFRKIFDTKCIENNVNHYVKEKLLGHRAKLELDIHYFRPTESLLLNEYLKVIDALTVNEENKLKRENRILKVEKEIVEHERDSIDLKVKELILQLNKKGLDLNI